MGSPHMIQSRHQATFSWSYVRHHTRSESQQHLPRRTSMQHDDENLTPEESVIEPGTDLSDAGDHVQAPRCLLMQRERNFECTIRVPEAGVFYFVSDKYPGMRLLVDVMQSLAVSVTSGDSQFL